MRFDKTNGKEARYMVTLYGWNVEDHYYCDSYKAAKMIFDEISHKDHEKGVALSIYDMKKDIRKAFIKF